MELVFDIETCGVDLEELSESQQEFIFRQAEKEHDDSIKKEKKEDAVRYLSLYPFTSRVVSIAMLNTDTGNMMVLYEGENEEWTSEQKPVKYRAMSEKDILEHFWRYAGRVDKVITFNGRNFDIPFLMMRSAMLKVKPTVNFMGNKFDTAHHIDLLEQFTFYGTTRKFNLDFYCHAFGIESPKGKGVTGMEVKQLYEAGKLKEIAAYNADDVFATYELYKIWKEFLVI